MNEFTDKQAEIDARLRRQAQSTDRRTLLISDDGSCLAPGQVWSVAGGCGEQPPWSWLVMELLDDNCANCLAIAAWGELAGPDDLFVNIDASGMPAIVSFETFCTLDRTALDHCLGRLPESIFAYISGAFAVKDDAQARQAYSWGMAYFNAQSPRASYHDYIAHRTEELQASARQLVYQDDAAPLELVPPGANQVVEILKFVQPAAVSADTLAQIWPFRQFADSFAEFVSPAAAADDQICLTSAIILARGGTTAEVRCVQAECTEYMTLAGEGMQSTCWCWTLPVTFDVQAVALIYVDSDVMAPPLGIGQIDAAGEQSVVTLSNYCLPPGTSAIQRPDQLKMVIVSLEV